MAGGRDHHVRGAAADTVGVKLTILSSLGMGHTITPVIAIFRPYEAKS